MAATSRYPTITAHLSCETADRYNVYRTVTNALYNAGMLNGVTDWQHDANTTQTHAEIVALAETYVVLA